MMRSVIIAGSRTVWPTVAEISQAILELDPSGLLWVPREWEEIVCGMAPGADLAGLAWAEARELYVHREPVTGADRAQWGPHIAPKIRNRRMAERGHGAILFWDGISGGTANMACQMVARGKPVAVIPWRSRTVGARR